MTEVVFERRKLCFCGAKGLFPEQSKIKSYYYFLIKSSEWNSPLVCAVAVSLEMLVPILLNVFIVNLYLVPHCKFSSIYEVIRRSI